MNPIKSLNEYTTEELRKLYKSYTLYLVTEHIRRELTTQNNKYGYEMVSQLYVDNDNENKYYHHDMVRFYNNISITNLENKLDDESLSDTVKRNIKDKIYYYKVCNEVLFWNAGGYEKLIEDYDNNADVNDLNDPDELFEELHSQDFLDEELGRPTKEEIYNFIWETLRYCDVKTLRRLLNYADKKFDIAPAHRPKYNKKIYKYDKEGNLIDTFNDREDCITKDNVTKNALSMHLTGKRKTLKGFIYKEEETVN